MNNFIRNERQQKIVDRASEIAQAIQPDSSYYDRTGAFPFANFDQLKQHHYQTLTIPKTYGGEDLSLYELMLTQETLAQGDASTALAMGWHLGVMMDLNQRHEWDESVYRRLCEDVVQNGTIVNRAMTEPKTGNPVRGGLPATVASKRNNGWVINGHKTFTTLAPLADTFIVNANIEGTDEIGGFLVQRDQNGVDVKQTWDTIGMRATRSDDIYFDHVEVPAEAYVETIDYTKKDRLPAAWLLHIPACYMGVAIAAKNDAIRFAKEYQPNSLDHPIQDLPHIQDKVARIEMDVLRARTLMYSVARDWDERPERHYEMAPELGAVKYEVTNTAVRVVDTVMRIVGGSGLSKSLPFEKYYRDVLPGVHNPPNDDAVMAMMARRAFS
ncbi:acyl-CoA dehydrogenase family protein [Tuberibacillus sp. Marseille-P3662]|uniref:acyl-CoA dehydrogenase family protein n=1 Tax=Tuberibacillus sp. Marseille-P3662 TaxID=1965358 RepID=UPI000A1CC92B|nr:acyl-CoA dehydrogenase family protein [Tuberibacillus sp. Marseille-P3662]